MEAWRLAGSPWHWSSREMRLAGCRVVVMDEVRFHLKNDRTYCKDQLSQEKRR